MYPGAKNQQPEDDGPDEVEELKTKLDELELTEEAKKITTTELKKLRQLGPRNQEYHVSMNYLNTIAELPWGKFDDENLEPELAHETLDRDHFGLD